MRLPLTHQQPGEQPTRGLTVPLGRGAVVLVVWVAGLIHLALIREHFAEQFVYGLVFTALALFQLTLALWLGVRPGPRVYRVGIWGSGLIVLVYVLTRLIPLPGASAPEEVDALGIVATGLELAAVVLLALALPEPTPRRASRRAPLWWGLGSAVGFAPLWLIATGVVQWTDAVYPTSLAWYGTNFWTTLTPILAGSPLPHLWLAAPWWSLPAALLLAVLVGLTLWSSTRLVVAGSLSGRGRRGNLLTLLPAGLAAPVCCSASTPLLALLGVPLVLGIWAAPFAVLLSAVLLTLSLVVLHIQGRRGTCVRGVSGQECSAAPAEAEKGPAETTCTLGTDARYESRNC